MSKTILIALCLMTSLVARVSSAGDVVYYGADEKPDPELVARILSGPSKVARPPLKMRSIRLLGDDAAAQAAPKSAQAGGESSVAAAPAATDPSGLALPVQFAFDSARILPEATPQLDALAEGIRLAGPAARVVVEGHTDAVGSEEYNLRLSISRAAAVKSYLVSRHGIDPQRLQITGRGKYEPIEGRDPFAPENRRVEFRPARG